MSGGVPRIMALYALSLIICRFKYGGGRNGGIFSIDGVGSCSSGVGIIVGGVLTWFWVSG